MMKAAAMVCMVEGGSEEEDPQRVTSSPLNQPHGRFAARLTGPGAGWPGAEAGPTGPETSQHFLTCFSSFCP